MYIQKFKSTEDWVNFKRLGLDDLKTLGKIFKIEQKRQRRSDPTYSMAENQKQKEKRKAQRTDEDKCAKMYFEKVDESFSKKCEGCEGFSSPEKVENIPNTNGLFICKNCNEIEEKMNDLGTFGGEGFVWAYEDWAKENFCFQEEILRKKKIIKDHWSAGIRMFNDGHKRKTIIYPQVGKSHLTISIDEKHEGMENCNPVVLLPQSLFVEDHIGRLSKDVFELANRWFGQAHIVNILSVLILDRLGSMTFFKQLRQKQNSEVKRGYLEDNKLSLIDSESDRGCLSEVKGSSDFLSKQTEDLHFRQLQNGFKNIKIKWPVYEGYSQAFSDPFLATAVLRTKGFKVKSIEKASDGRFPSRDFRVCCDDEECNPFVCTKVPQHNTPLEIMNNDKPDVDIMFVAKFMTEKIKSFVDQIVKPISKEYALFLKFDKSNGDNDDSSFFLHGNIWTEELALLNLSGEDIHDPDELLPAILKHENLSKFFGGSGKVMVANGMVKWNNIIEQDDVTPPVLENVEFDEMENCREASLVEALMVCGRSQQIHWYSQQMLYINIEDPRKVRMDIQKI